MAASVASTWDVLLLSMPNPIDVIDIIIGVVVFELILDVMLVLFGLRKLFCSNFVDGC